MKTPTRIEGLRASSFTVPTEEPESDGTLSWNETTVVVAEVHGAGCEGLGFTYGPAACATVVGDVLAHVVTGRDVFDVPGSWSAMVRAVRNAGRPGIASMAVAAVDVALWDLKARACDLPLARLLGCVREQVPIYGSGGFTSLSEKELRAQLGEWVHDDGIPRVKMKVGTDWGREPARDVARVRIARDEIGAGAELFVDANAAYTRKQAVRQARAFMEHDVVWFEEPVSSDDLDGLREIRDVVDCDVAAGEYGYDLAYFDRMCRAGAVDVLQADVSRCAGITEWMRVAAVAAAQGLDISGHCAQSLHLHPACATPNVRHLEYFADHARVDRVLFDGVREPRHGTLCPDGDRPGLGLELKRADAARYLR